MRMLLETMLKPFLKSSYFTSIALLPSTEHDFLFHQLQANKLFSYDLILMNLCWLLLFILFSSSCLEIYSLMTHFIIFPDIAVWLTDRLQYDCSLSERWPLYLSLHSLYEFSKNISNLWKILSQLLQNARVNIVWPQWLKNSQLLLVISNPFTTLGCPCLWH